MYEGQRFDAIAQKKIFYSTISTAGKKTISQLNL